jgi:hypothetical protein
MYNFVAAGLVRPGLALGVHIQGLYERAMGH